MCNAVLDRDLALRDAGEGVVEPESAEHSSTMAKAPQYVESLIFSELHSSV